MDHFYQEEGSIYALPTPTDTPFHSRPRSRSRHSGRRGSMSPDISSSPAPLLSNGDLSSKTCQDTMNSATDESISPLDPRRFTPSLHASLVSEILSLRRDVEGKTKSIEHLEDSLHTTRDENESLHQSAASTLKETRSLKRQLQLLEGGTASALSELAKERVQAMNDSADLRKRLEQSQKKVRSQEEGMERRQILWDCDRGNWEKEKRTLESKVHVVEGRLKVVLSEIANSYVVNRQPLHQDVHQYESPKKMHIRKGSVASIRSIGPMARRRDSEASSGTQEGDFLGHRLSATILTNGHPTSLADELCFDEEEEDKMDHNEVQEEQISSDELPEERPMSAQSRPFDSKARKILGLAAEDHLPVLSETEQQRQSVDANTTTNDVISKIQAMYDVKYVDAAIQYSPPSSPQISTTTHHPQAIYDDDRTVDFTDALSHQEPESDWKQVNESHNPSTPSKAQSTMVSTSCQTSSQLPSPPWTPLSPRHSLDEEIPSVEVPEPPMISIATQTEAVQEPEESQDSETPQQQLPVPLIAIHPPDSRPTTPTSDVVLPPRTKNASCQVNIEAVVDYTSSAMQTEEIRIDARTVQLPQILLPERKGLQPIDNGAMKRTPTLPLANPLPNSSKRRLQQPGSIKPASSRRKAWELPAEALVYSPPRETDGPISSVHVESQKRTSESSASFGGVDSPGYEGPAEADITRFDEDDIFSRPTAKFTLKSGKLVSKNEPDTYYQDVFDKIDAEADELEMSPVEENPTEMPTTMLSRRGERGHAGPGRSLESRQKTLRSTSSRQFDIRKAALISSGTAAHQSARDQSQSVPVKPPPFPVPTRNSSRKPPLSISEGAQSPTPSGRSPRKRDGKPRKPLLRKVRSATSVTRTSVPTRQRTPSPTFFPSVSDNVNDAGLPLPPMPFDDTTRPASLGFAASFADRGPVRPSFHNKSDSASTVLQQTSVVDAIAQTMVGEWMYKYVRRRKSFGVSESKSADWDLMRNGEELSATITNTGVRHKRWVWLAPYERAVMWSSKQPTSGSALMGKSGRKLEIQSVLDVRDDNPLPRGSGPGPHFNRSILILTPQRALKFTATTQERHYVWLTALSFLSHSPLGLGDLTALPRAPQQEYVPPTGLGGSLRRNPIRDSIRVAKGRDSRVGRSGGQRAFTTDGIIPRQTPEHEVKGVYESISDAADPPTVPRYHSHNRQRSNTGPRPHRPSFRNLSNHHYNPIVQPPPPPSTYSMTTATMSDIHTPSSLYNGHPGIGFPTTHSNSSRRGSSASNSLAPNGSAGSAGVVGGNLAGYFESYVSPSHPPPLPPTMRMEAFIGEEGGPRPRGSYRTRQGRKKDMGYWGVGDRGGGGILPGMELSDEVVGGGVGHGMRHPHRTSSRSPTTMTSAGGNQMGAYPGLHGVNVVGEDHGGSGHGHGHGGVHHFRGF